jgi:hypothetical protein
MPWADDTEPDAERGEGAVRAYEEAYEIADHAWDATLSDLVRAMRLLDYWGRVVTDGSSIRQKKPGGKKSDDDRAEAARLAIVLQARAAIEAAEIQRKETRWLVWGTWFLVIVTAVLAVAAFQQG